MINNLRKKLKGRFPQKGFTMIEMLVAVLLLVTAITGPLTIASKGLTASIVAKDQITAFYLAQDAVEYVRFLRDSNCLPYSHQTPSVPCSSSTWLAGLDGSGNGHTSVDGLNGDCVSTNGSRACYLDSIHDAITTCTSNNCSVPLRYDTTNGYFTISGGTVTPQNFKRTVRLVTSGSNEVALTVGVTWSDQANITRSVEVRENILNWQ